ncbi:hypothetical protein SO694_00003776 [Aureococcus anophagefferens]|uniref:Uncharacterized protein n=1 Tax=Aureococcus anophagefferens TaxID=44056 RepID=A0ABR1GDQ3_AURAN
MLGLPPSCYTANGAPLCFDVPTTVLLLGVAVAMWRASGDAQGAPKATPLRVGIGVAALCAATCDLVLGIDAVAAVPWRLSRLAVGAGARARLARRAPTRRRRWPRRRPRGSATRRRPGTGVTPLAAGRDTRRPVLRALGFSVLGDRPLYELETHGTPRRRVLYRVRVFEDGELKWTCAKSFAQLRALAGLVGRAAPEPDAAPKLRGPAAGERLVPPGRPLRWGHDPDAVPDANAALGFALAAPAFAETVRLFLESDVVAGGADRWDLVAPDDAGAFTATWATCAAADDARRRARRALRAPRERASPARGAATLLNLHGALAVHGALAAGAGSGRPTSTQRCRDHDRYGARAGDDDEHAALGHLEDALLRRPACAQLIAANLGEFSERPRARSTSARRCSSARRGPARRRSAPRRPAARALGARARHRAPRGGRRRRVARPGRRRARQLALRRRRRLARSLASAARGRRGDGVRESLAPAFDQAGDDGSDPGRRRGSAAGDDDTLSRGSLGDGDATFGVTVVLPHDFQRHALRREPPAGGGGGGGGGSRGPRPAGGPAATPRTRRARAARRCDAAEAQRRLQESEAAARGRARRERAGLREFEDTSVPGDADGPASPGRLERRGAAMRNLLDFLASTGGRATAKALDDPRTTTTRVRFRRADFRPALRVFDAKGEA